MAAYARLARGHPRLWSMVYHRSTSLNPQWVLGPFLKSGFEREIAEVGPDVVVSVLPAINGLLAQAANYTGARLEVVLTDWHSVHRFWVARGVSHYSVPTESARQDCIRFGAPPDSIEVAGIPVRSEFAGSIDRHAARARLRARGLDSEKFTILAMVGAEGSPRALANIARLAQLDLDAQMLVRALEGLASLLTDGQPDRAVRLVGAAEHLRQTIGAPALDVERQRLEEWLTGARRQLGDQRFASAHSAGREMTLEQACADALRPAVEPHRSAGEARGVLPGSRPHDALSRREQEVATLIAEGRTNHEIALALVVTDRTAEHHVENILGKLGLSSRTQIGVWVVEHGLRPRGAR